MSRIARVYLVSAMALLGPMAVAHADNSQIAENVAALGDQNPAKRDAAQDALCALGRRAEPALEAAAKSDDPEVAERAGAILWRVRSGISPASPPALLKLVARCREGNDEQRHAALTRLTAEGAQGMRILAALAHGATGPGQRDLTLKVMTTRASEAAALLIADGDDALAMQVLAEAVEQGNDSAARDLTALESCSNGLDARIATLQKRIAAGASGSDADFLCCAQRAAGDLPAARKSALQSGNKQLVIDMLLLQPDWIEGARALIPGEGADSSLELLGLKAYCERLAGNADAVAKIIPQIQTFADTHPDSYAVDAAARSLCFLGAPDAAGDLLIRHNNVESAVRFQIHRMKLHQAAKLIESIANPPPVQELRLALLATQISLEEGEKQQAAESFARAVQLAKPLNDAASWGLIAQSARTGADRANSDEYLARAIAVADRGRAIEDILTRAGVSDIALAAQWWWFLRPQAHGDDVMPVARRFVSLLKERSPSPVLKALAVEMQGAITQSPSRASMTSLAARTLVAAGSIADAESFLSAQVSELQVPELLLQLGDCQEQLGKWSLAAAACDRAWDLDRSQPAPLLLEGLALRHDGGSTDDAQKMIDQAHRLALANDAQRLQLLSLCKARHADADADFERNMLLRIGDPRGRERVQVLVDEVPPAAANADGAAAEPLTAVLIQFASGRLGFADGGQTLHAAAMLDSVRARAALDAGNIKAAFDLAMESGQIEPIANDVFLNLIRAFADGGHNTESDELRKQAAETLDQLIGDFPQSPYFENDLAWLLARTGGDLDVALSHAARATQLDPQSAAIADTLAEVYFRRHDLKKAVDAMQKCVALAPDQPREQKRLEDFQAALAKERK
jgi:tetratricopeptide (TPR) repeat protein